MSSIRIGTWNIKNNYFNLRKNDRKIVAIKELLNRTNLDVLALQDVSGILLDKLEKELELCHYHLDRYLYLNNPMMPTPFEIHNVVIIKDSFINNTDVLKLKTLSPTASILDVPALKHKYVSKVYIQDEKDKNIAFDLYNVNLDERVNVVETQLESLGESLNKKNPMIVMGSLNISSTSIEMAQFRYKFLNKKMLTTIDVSTKTYKYNEEDEATDHIIIPNWYKVEDVNVVEDYSNVSSHYPVVAKIKMR